MSSSQSIAVTGDGPSPPVRCLVEPERRTPRPARPGSRPYSQSSAASWPARLRPSGSGVPFGGSAQDEPPAFEPGVGSAAGGTRFGGGAVRGNGGGGLFRAGGVVGSGHVAVPPSP